MIFPRIAISILVVASLLLLDSMQASAAVHVQFEAESGTLGTEWAVSNSTSPNFITITTDNTTNNPANDARVATYSVTFPMAGTYQLYGRIRTGAGGFNDDSLFLGNGFGAQSATLSSDWLQVNGLAGVGFSSNSNVVTGGGTAGNSVWKWINFSQYIGNSGVTVPVTNLTQTYQIGARENGLDLDKFIFGVSGVLFTVSNLDAGVDGVLPNGQVTLNWNDPRQQMDGFGAGMVFLDGGLSPITDANADKLFKMDTTSQLGLTLMRIRIGPNSNWSNSVSTWNDSNLTDAKKAVARGAKILASPWTPPTAMKSNGVLTNGSLLPEQYANYAAYLNKYAYHMLTSGVPLRAVSVQNEPDWGTTYESCVWSPTQLFNFFRTNAAAVSNAPLMMPESLGFNPSYSDPTLNDTIAVTNVGLIGGHLYGVNTINPHPNAIAKGKNRWMTEYLENDQTIESSMQTARQINDCLTTGSMSAYIWWKCLGNANGLLNASGVIQKRGYMMAQFSRFVRPGHYRIGETNSGSSSVSAFKNVTNNQFAIVAVNSYSLAFDQTFVLTNFPPSITLTPWITSATQSLVTLPAITVTNGTFTYNLPANSVITFAGQVNSNTAPVFASVAHQTVNPGFTVLVTNAVSDSGLPGQTLTFALLAAPTNATLTTLNASNALFTWRPLISQAASSNSIQVKVTDNGVPNLSATNNFVITVNPASPPAFNSISGGAQVSLVVTGFLGPDYSLLTSTNLVNWQSLRTTNPTVMPFTFTDTNTSEMRRFYRIQLGP